MRKKNERIGEEERRTIGAFFQRRILASESLEDAFVDRVPVLLKHSKVRILCRHSTSGLFRNESRLIVLDFIGLFVP